MTRRDDGPAGGRRARVRPSCGPDATAEQLLAWAAETFGDKLIVASNMQDAVLVDLAARRRRASTCSSSRPATTSRRPSAPATPSSASTTCGSSTRGREHTVAEQDALLGKDLFARDPNQCCALRKVVPLQNTLAGYDAWVTGVRRVEARPGRTRRWSPTTRSSGW